MEEGNISKGKAVAYDTDKGKGVAYDMIMKMKKCDIMLMKMIRIMKLKWKAR